MREEGLLAARPSPEDAAFDEGLRPATLDEFIGQDDLKERLSILVEAARGRGEALDHLLFSGPPGLGKTTLAAIVANEIGARLRATSGPALERAGDLAAILSNLEEGDGMFIDEIHRLPRAVEEILYTAMEDFQLDIVVGKGAGAHSIRLELPAFTLIGATTRVGRVSAPLRDRFGYVARIDYYRSGELEAVVARSSRLLEIEVTDAARAAIGARSRGTPRIANRLLRRVRDFAEVRASGSADEDIARQALEVFEVDAAGLDRVDRAILESVIHKFGGGPVGLSTLAIAVSEEPQTVEDAYEPFLLQMGFLQRTPRGRVATRLAYEHIGVPVPDAVEQGRLL
ncbi:MAG TPA: Holliday junction branch migration DNA helicase RuvB [Acidimicrobiia bacterium]|nr:Holliday junction branch migration DNA helicase RuvB [Acidimicrobiia bacterium]